MSLTSYLICLLSLSFLYSCGSDESIIPEEDIEYFLNISNQNFSYKYNYQEEEIEIKTNIKDLTVTVNKEDQDWMTAQYLMGNPGRLIVLLDENFSDKERKTSILVGSRDISKSIQISQKGKISTAEDIYNFDYNTIFTNQLCSELKEGITEADIKDIKVSFFQNLASALYKNEYDKEFRIQEYKPYQKPSIMSRINKTSTYSLLDNPTGMVTQKDELLVLFVENPSKQSLSINVQDLQNGYNTKKYKITEGVNVLSGIPTGLIYIIYHTDEATEAPAKIHIATGSVNGYFDCQKHSNQDWARLLDKATFNFFDVLGKYAHLTYPISDFRNKTPDGEKLIEAYDDLVKLEHEFMGLYKYDTPATPRLFKNRMYFHVHYEDSYMYATSYRTAYIYSTMNDLCNVSNFRSTPWGPAHEVGHCNQLRPNLTWKGMTEVTNNIYSQFVRIIFGNNSYLEQDKVYEKAYKLIMSAKIPHNSNSLSDNPFEKLVPFWQLKLYLMDVLGKDFYPDLYEYHRINNNPPVGATDGQYQLDFVRTPCMIAKLDLTEFFEQWGFLTPINEEVNDYGSSLFTITQEQINLIKNEIKAANYPKPEHAVQYITDTKTDIYKNKTPIVIGTYSKNGNEYLLANWSNVAAFEVYKDGKFDSSTTNTTIKLDDASGVTYKMYAVDSRGNRVLIF